MKVVIACLAFLAFSSASFSQLPAMGTIAFDGSPDDSLIRFNPSDSASLWQIGAPHKTLFASAFSSPNAIVTDTLYPYPVNSFSQFFLVTGIDFGDFGYLSFLYNSNTDTLNDFGTVDVHFQGDTAWYNLFTLSGNSNGWIWLSTNVGNQIQLHSLNLGDTMIYRFTFRSDSIFDNKDGLMFDDIFFANWWEGIQRAAGLVASQAIPNPVSIGQIVRVQTGVKSGHVVVTNMLGQKVYESDFENQIVTLNSTFPGLYRYTITDGRSDKTATGMFIVTE